ncbi:uncharacterized protein LOC115074319 [Rhinatrema bivittatum]|uniref:uncharacterized protein LOC115074319 n=1 Tax=Rhinatrema bivittatum TaxID=194408 RepID=UPI00112DB9CE|nr:uncharacterized protein LOC115074319 [Rhinatrema bivittatum]
MWGEVFRLIIAGPLLPFWVRCVFPYYCPPGSAQMLPCDGGHMPQEGSGLRDSLQKSCRSCEMGTYRSSATSEMLCQACPEGFSCPQGVESYLQHPCPAGYYCPSMASVPVPCPPGSYGNTSHAKHSAECYPCPADTYNHLFGQTACFPCGSSSFSQTGATSCHCRGQNRVFQESDGSCICQAGFIYYDERGKERSDGNSDLSCQLQVEERCAVTEVRLASTRKCVVPEQYDCATFCGQFGGELSPELGICHCMQYVSAEELCDRFCLMGAPRVSLSVGSNREFLLHLTWGKERRSREMEVLSVLGPEEHVWNSERVHFVLFGPRGVYGLILSSVQVLETFLSGKVCNVD